MVPLVWEAKSRGRRSRKNQCYHARNREEMTEELRLHFHGRLDVPSNRFSDFGGGGDGDLARKRNRIRRDAQSAQMNGIGGTAAIVVGEADQQHFGLFVLLLNFGDASKDSSDISV